MIYQIVLIKFNLNILYISDEEIKISEETEHSESILKILNSDNTRWLSTGAICKVLIESGIDEDVEDNEEDDARTYLDTIGEELDKLVNANKIRKFEESYNGEPFYHI